MSNLIANFNNTHQQFLQYMQALNDVEFSAAPANKWTPGQQLEHVYLCLKPLAQVLASKEFIQQKFGTINRPTANYDEVISNYKAALEKGGKAPDRFVPAAVEVTRKADLIKLTNQMLDTISSQLQTYTDTELDSLAIPHPLLGNLSIREMFHLMTYHATHHLNQTKQNLLLVKAA